MSIPKPKHLGPAYAEHFKDGSVVGAYVNYPPYSAEVFEVLDGLMLDEPRIVLDIGCGTGELARPLAAFSDRVDAVDPSAAMVRLGPSRDGGDRPNIRWVCQRAEDFLYETRYSLIVAGASIHWMDWYTVLPHMARSLLDRGYLAIVGGHEMVAPWIDDLRRVIPKYSTNKDFAPYNVIDELEHRDLFSVVDRRRTTPRQHYMSIDQYVELLHARSGFSRQHMGPQSASEFDATVRDLVSPFAHRQVLTLEMATTITWGHPSASPEGQAGHLVPG